MKGKEFQKMYEISLFSRLYEMAPMLVVPETVPNFRLPMVPMANDDK